jgi:hypothetical protein
MPSPRREFPYFKVQTFDERSMTWKERKVGFDTVEEARAFVASLHATAKWKIVVFDEDGHRDIELSQ